MKPEQQRIAIAEVCGWEDCRYIEGLRNVSGIPPNSWRGNCISGLDVAWTPDYLNDLNAMHEAEISVFSDSGMQCDYSRSLIRVIKERSHLGKSFFSDFDLAHATAAQRAEAFLRTLNLWRDDA